MGSRFMSSFSKKWRIRKTIPLAKIDTIVYSEEGDEFVISGSS